MSGRTVGVCGHAHGACHARIAILRADRRGANSCESFIHGGIDFIFATPLQVDGSCENAEHDLQQNMRSFQDIHWQLHDRSEAGCCASFWLQQAKPSTNQVHTNTSDLDELHDGPKRWKRSTVGANLALSWHVTVACAKSCGWQCEFCKHESIKRKNAVCRVPATFSGSSNCHSLSAIQQPVRHCASNFGSYFNRLELAGLQSN